MQGKLEQISESELSKWEPRNLLEEPSPHEIYYSQGLLRIDYTKWFSDLASDWLPLFHALGTTVSSVSCSTHFEFPSDLVRVTPLEINGEIAVIGLSEVAENKLVSQVTELGDEISSDILLEYLERRLTSTLSTSWSGPGELKCLNISPDAAEAVEVVSCVCISFEIEGSSAEVWLGIGPKLTEFLDTSWKKRTAAITFLEGLNQISFRLAKLKVSPSQLIDYIRAGSVIDTEHVVGGEVEILLNRKLLAKGTLCQSEGRFAVKIESLVEESDDSNESFTSLELEIAGLEFDGATAVPGVQEGSYLISNTAVSNTALMLVSGETVAKATIGQLNGTYALHVLPR